MYLKISDDDIMELATRIQVVVDDAYRQGQQAEREHFAPESNWPQIKPGKREIGISAIRITFLKSLLMRYWRMVMSKHTLGPWKPVATAPTDTPLLATYLDVGGKPKIMRAELIGRFTQEASPAWNCVDYDETTDCWYRAAGWVELMDHWDDADSCYINAQIIGWMPLPKPMEP